MPEGMVGEPFESGPAESPQRADLPIADPARLRQRAVFLRELAEARALLARTTPWRTRTSQLRERLRRSTFHV